MIEQIVEPDENEVILLNTAKKYNVSSSECVIGVEYRDPVLKAKFEQRMEKYRYKFV